MNSAFVTLGAALLGTFRPDASPAADYSIPTIEVRADRRGDAAGPLPLASTVLGREEIARRPGGDLADLLAPVAGLRLASRGDPALGTLVSIRGSTSEQVLVLVDGRRVNAAQGGGVDLATIPLDSVERVEVLRGGASSTWGPDAIGGAIHVRTRSPSASAPREGRIRLAGGSGGARDALGNAALRIASEWRARVGGRFVRTDGDAPLPEGGEIDRARNADVRRATFDAALDGTLTPNLRLRADASMLRAERGVPGSEEFPTPSARLHDERETLGLRMSRGDAGAWSSTLDVSAFDAFRRYNEPGAALGAIDESHQNRRAEGEVALARRGPRGGFAAAAGGALDRLESTTDGRRSRESAFARAQLVRDGAWGARTTRAMASARVDGVEGFAPFASPRLGAEIDLVPERLRARASAGLAYRPPTFDDLFWPARATASGNPDLRAERSRDVDLGFEGTTSAGEALLAVEAFARVVDDLIQWTPGAGGIWRPHNVGRARFLGMEGEARFRRRMPVVREAELSASVTRLSTRDESGEPNVDGKELVARPRWSGAASLLLGRGARLEFETVVRFVDDSWITRANTKRLEGFALTEVRARTRFTRSVALDAAVTNLFDRAARDFRDFPLPGRAFELGLTFEGVSR